MRSVWLLRACHPDACAAVTAVAVLLGIAAGGRGIVLALIGAAVLAGQLCVGWLNDFLDADRDTNAARADKPIAAGRLDRRVAGRAAAIAGVACVPLSLATGVLAGSLHIIAVGSALCYDLGWKATRWSLVPYLVSFGLLPVFVLLASQPITPPWWLPAAGALLGGGAHFANVLPDLADDLAAGVRGLPHRLGERASRWCAAALLLTASLVLVIGPPPASLGIRLTLAGLAIATLLGGMVVGRRPGSRVMFQAVLVVALCDVGQLLVAGAALH